MDRIKEFPDYMKDQSSKAILNTNKSVLEEYKKKLSMENDIKNLQFELSGLKTDITDIKNLLLNLNK